MFHRKHSAGTKQKDKFRHRKAIHRIVSRPHNLKFPGGHDAFTNYLPKYAYGWFATVAEELEENNFAKEIRASAPKTESEAYYNKENLSMTKTKALTNNN